MTLPLDIYTLTVSLDDGATLSLDFEESEAGKVGQPKGGPTRIHIRVRGNEGFDTIRTIEFGKGIQARIGFKDGKSSVISLLFDKAKWTPEEARKWYKGHRESLASQIENSEASIFVEPALLDQPVEDFGFEILDPTPSKAYAVFKLLSFHPVVNQRHDTFDEADVGDKAIASLIGSPIYGNENLTDHFMSDGTRGPQVGAVIGAKKKTGDGIYALAAFYKDKLEEYGVDAKNLPKAFSVSMEVKFDADEARYAMDGKILSRSEAVASGVANTIASADDPHKYTARFLVPIEYHAVALLRRGRNADSTADVLLAAASKEQDMPENIEWSQDDFDSFVETAESYGALLSSKERKSLNKSDFAYVDDKGVGHLPIMDAAHVRNALARLNQTKIPAGAKRGAYRKIAAKAKQLGISVDKKSAAHQAYGALDASMPLEQQREEMCQAVYEWNSKYYLVYTYMGYLIISDNERNTFRVDYTIDQDGNVTFGQPTEVHMTYAAAGSTIGSDKQMTDEELKTREEALKAREDAFKAESEAFKTKEPELAKAAVEAFKVSDAFKTLMQEAKVQAVTEHENTRQAIASRMEELKNILPFKNDEDRIAVEAKVTESVADEVKWLQLKTERLQTVLASRKSSIKPPVPTLVAQASTRSLKDIFDFTTDEE